MTHSRVDEILQRLYDLQQDLEIEIDKVLSEKRDLFQYTLEKGRIKFEEGVRALHLSQKTGVIKYLMTSELKHILVAPLIYSLFLPILLIDLSVSIYQHVCFRVYKIPLVNRRKYFIFDRQKLDYLNIIEKINCNYCSYADGVFAYVREIIARTEQYWCPIKHARRSFHPHSTEDRFVDFGDAQGYQNRLDNLRKEWSNCES